MKQTSSHIPLEKLADLAESRLTGAEREAAHEHARNCPACAGQLAELEKVIGLMRSDKAEDAPRDVIHLAVSQFNARARKPEKSLVRTILAALSFDSAQMTPAFGVRSGGQPETRQLLYRAGDTDLDIRVASSDDRWVVSGQVLGAEDLSEGSIELEGEGAQVASSLNDLSEFTLPPVPTGSYTLRLRLMSMEIEVPGFNLGS